MVENRRKGREVERWAMLADEPPQVSREGNRTIVLGQVEKLKLAEWSKAEGEPAILIIDTAKGIIAQERPKSRGIVAQSGSDLPDRTCGAFSPAFATDEAVMVELQRFGSKQRTLRKGAQHTMSEPQFFDRLG
jgi:hypothetical protein